MSEHNSLASIEFMTYPNLRLHCSNGVKFEASLNVYNRQKLDQMRSFPKLEIEDYNAHHGMLSADGLAVVVYLERIY